MKNKRKRPISGWIAALAAGAVAAAAAIRIAARRNVRREQAEREHLGDLLHTEIAGSGEPVVFLAGLQGSTRYWAKIFGRLSNRRRVVAVDALGFALSPWPSGLAYDLEDQVGALRRTLVAHGVDRDVTLVAHSFGTIIAASYAERYAGEVKRVVLLGSPIFSDRADAMHHVWQLNPIGALFAFNRALAHATCTVMCAFRPLILKSLPRFFDRHEHGVVMDAALHHFPAIDGAVNRILLRQPIEPTLRQLDGRLVLIHGLDDRVTPIERVRRIASESGAELMEVPGGHHSYTTDHLLLLEAIIAPHGSKGGRRSSAAP